MAQEQTVFFGAAICAQPSQESSLWSCFGGPRPARYRGPRGAAVPGMKHGLIHRSTTVLLVGDFDDVLAANQEYVAAFDHDPFDGIAHAGIAVITCMDSRIEPLRCSACRSVTPRSFATRVDASPRKPWRRSYWAPTCST